MIAIGLTWLTKMVIRVMSDSILGNNWPFFLVCWLLLVEETFMEIWKHAVVSYFPFSFQSLAHRWQSRLPAAWGCCRNWGHNHVPRPTDASRAGPGLCWGSLTVARMGWASRVRCRPQGHLHPTGIVCALERLWRKSVGPGNLPKPDLGVCPAGLPLPSIWAKDWNEKGK